MRQEIRYSILTLAAASTVISGCGDGTKTVEVGEFRCVTVPCEANFGAVEPTRRRNAQFVVSNIGLGVLDITSLRIEGTSPLIQFSDATGSFIGGETNFEWRIASDGQSFNVTGDAVFTLAPDERLDIEIEFLGDDRGRHLCPGEQEGTVIRCGEVVVVSNDINDSDRVIRAPILLSLVDSRMVVEPTTLSFSAPLVSDTGSGFSRQERTFAVQSVGTGQLRINDIQPSIGALQVKDISSGTLQLPVTIVSGARREFLVEWEPESDAPLSALITITSDATTGGAQTIVVDSSGSDAPEIAITPCAFDFGSVPVGDVSEILFDVANNGNAPMTWTMTLAGITPAAARNDLALQLGNGQPANGPQSSLPVGETRAMKLTYTPTSESAVSGTVRFTGNFGSSRECPITAGEATPRFDVTPSALFFGGVAQGEATTLSVVVQNGGRSTLEVERIGKSGDLAGEFTVPALDAGGFSLAPGETRRVVVTYERLPDDLPGPDEGRLIFEHNVGEGGSTQVSLLANNGDGIRPPTCVVESNPPAPYDVGDSVTFDGTASELNGGAWSPSKFTWTLTRPSASEATLSSGFADTTTLTLDASGTYSVALNATAAIGAVNASCERIVNIVVP